jgi:hypothetical protein
MHYSKTIRLYRIAIRFLAPESRVSSSVIP